MIRAKDLGIQLEKKEQPLFEWFLASYLLGKRIQQNIATQTWSVFMKHGINTPHKIIEKSWQELVDLLGEGHYRRYDESTARNLRDMAHTLIRDYHGKLLNMYNKSRDFDDFSRQLQRLKGVGPKTAEIFLREARNVLADEEKGGQHGP